MFQPPGVVPKERQYSDTTVPLLQVKVTEEEVNVEPGAGLVICALARPGGTIRDQLSSSEPALLVARIVMVWGLPADVGFDQVTTPVLLLMVMPIGPVTRVHVTGCAPLTTGVGPVYETPSCTVSSPMGEITGASGV